MERAYDSENSNTHLTIVLKPDSIAIAKDFVVYPNPNRTKNLTISTRTSLLSGGRVIILNMLGQIVQKNSIAPISQGGKLTIPIQLSKGRYIIKLAAGGENFTAKFIVL